jgi:putative DNA primase/helicase
VITLTELARALGGEIVGHRVLCPGPGHTPSDRSMSVWLALGFGGFIAHSHAGDGWQTCRDYISARLGLPVGPAKFGRGQTEGREEEERERAAKEAAQRAALETAEAVRRAISLWNSATDPRGTAAEVYLRRDRRLDLGDDLAGGVIRWHAASSALIALFRDMESGEARAISRVYLDQDARKIDRKFLGPVRGAAVMLDPLDAVRAAGRLHVAEGVESAMAARALGIKPTWAVGSLAGIQALPVHSNGLALIILGENDGRSPDICRASAARWIAAGRDARVVLPREGDKDLNDTVIRRARAS